MRTFIKRDYPVLKRIDSPAGRVYETPTGAKYPSITTVLGLLNAEKIKAWREAVGEEEANRISKQASSRGTSIHTLCEKFLLDQEYDVGMFDREMFNSLKPYLDKIDNIHALEQPLFSHRLKVCGTVDCIAEYEGVLSIIDFKTSRRIKTREEIHDYFMQTAAYSFMFWEMTGIPISDSVIIMGVDDEAPLIFKEKIKPWMPAFLSAREDYRVIKGI